MQNLARAASRIRYSNPTKSRIVSVQEVSRKKRIREFFLPNQESEVHQATNIVGISASIPQYN